MAGTSPRGYDFEFVSDVGEDLKCIICHLVLKEPVQIMSCGHRYCKACFQDMKAYVTRLDTGFICPVDRQAIDLNMVFEDKAVNRTIKELTVKCKLYVNGCRWKGSLGDLDEHMARCSWAEMDVIPPSNALDQNNMFCNHLLERIQKCEEESARKEKEMFHFRFSVKELKEDMKRMKDLNEEMKIEMNHLKQMNESMRKELHFKMDVIDMKRELKSRIVAHKEEERKQEKEEMTEQEGLCNSTVNISVVRPVTKENNKRPTFDLANDDTYNWVKTISVEKRRAVPKMFPPLRNIFYTRDRLLQAPWYEIELKNVKELLFSEAKMFFYASKFHRSSLECTFAHYSRNDPPEFVTHPFLFINNNETANCMMKRLGKSLQYLFILGDGNSVCGIAKLENILTPDPNQNWIKTSKSFQAYIQYLSLSNIGEFNITYSPQEGCTESLDRRLAKVLVQRYHNCLMNNQIVPVFENYYPWCGIPPLMEFRKPAYPIITTAGPVSLSRKDQRNRGLEDKLKGKDHAGRSSALRENSSTPGEGFYDGKGTWYPDMDSAVLAFTSSMKKFKDFDKYNEYFEDKFQ